jgi:hypothetical protein
MEITMDARDKQSVRVNITVPLAVKEAVAEYATKSGRSMSDLMAEAIEEKAKSMAKDELNQQLEAAYSEMAEELLAEVNEWDHVSEEAWRKLDAIDGEGKSR